MAETIGKSYAWIQENVTMKELQLWRAYWLFQHKEREGIPNKRVPEKDKLGKVKQMARVLGAKVVKRERGT